MVASKDALSKHMKKEHSESEDLEPKIKKRRVMKIGSNALSKIDDFLENTRKRKEKTLETSTSEVKESNQIREEDNEEKSVEALESIQSIINKELLSGESGDVTTTVSAIENGILEEDKNKSNEIKKIKVTSQAEASLKISELTEKVTNGFQCKHCGHISKHRPNLSIHISFHFVGLEFPCNFCDKVFAQKHSLYGHVKNAHKKIPIPKLK